MFFLGFYHQNLDKPFSYSLNIIRKFQIFEIPITYIFNIANQQLMLWLIWVYDRFYQCLAQSMVSFIKRNVCFFFTFPISIDKYPIRVTRNLLSIWVVLFDVLFVTPWKLIVALHVLFQYYSETTLKQTKRKTLHNQITLKYIIFSLLNEANVREISKSFG